MLYIVGWGKWNIKWQWSNKKKSKKQGKNKNKNLKKRLRVLSLKAEGAAYKEIMRITGYSKANVANIVKLYFEKGMEEIVTNKYGGNHRNLSYEEEYNF